MRFLTSLPIKPILLIIMKKLILTLLLLVGYGFLMVNSAQATSGACSGHGGVNCSAGADFDGSVICYDGWRSSSVSYSNMVSCSSYGSSYQAPSYYKTPSCPLMSYYDSLSGSCKCMSGYIVGKDFLGKEACVSADSVCRDQIGFMSRYNSLTGKCECSYGYVIYNGECTSQEDKCQSLYGYGTRFNSLKDNCECRSGYSFDGNKCALDSNGYEFKPSYNTPTKSCPQNSTLKTDGSCYCNTGFVVNTDKSACVPVSCSVNSSLVGDFCICNDGFVLKNGSCISYNDDCKNSFGFHTYGSKGESGNSACFCESGYQWNVEKTACAPNHDVVELQTGSSVLDMAAFCKTTIGENAVFDSGTGNCRCKDDYELKLGVCLAKVKFVGIPKNKADLLNCAVAGDKRTLAYYLRGAKFLNTASHKNKVCFENEATAKKAKYIKAKKQ